MRVSAYFLIILLIAMNSCINEDIETDPAKSIIGKWELTQSGNWPNMMATTATGYTEFCSDSVIRFFDYKLKKFTSIGGYSIADSVLFFSQIREDNYEIITKYKYEFLSKNKELRIDNIDLLAIFNTAIYRRIE